MATTSNVLIEGTDEEHRVYFAASDYGLDDTDVGDWTPELVYEAGMEPDSITLATADLSSPADDLEQAVADESAELVAADSVWKITALFEPADTDGFGGRVLHFQAYIRKPAPPAAVDDRHRAGEGFVLVDRDITP